MNINHQTQALFWRGTVDRAMNLVVRRHSQLTTGMAEGLSSCHFVSSWKSHVCRFSLFQKFRSEQQAFSTEFLALLTEARCKGKEKTMIVTWTIKESETIPTLKSLPELVGESRKEKGNISLNTIPVNSSFARAQQRKQTNKGEKYGK